jgi:hypothetical protein
MRRERHVQCAINEMSFLMPRDALKQLCMSRNCALTVHEDGEAHTLTSA